MLAQERRNHILERLQEEKSVVVGELSQRYGVSEETIRRDLDKLEKDGYAIKSYGGAVVNQNVSIDMPFNVRKKRNVVGKQKIAEIVSEMIDDGDHIILDASTTAVFIAKAIKDKKNLTIITNSIEIMIELSDVPDWNIISTGGSLREGYLALVGPRVVEGLRTYHVEKAFISCKGADLESGFTDSNEDFALTKRVMLSRAKEKVMVVDSSKIDTVAFAHIGDLDDVDAVVTDNKPSKKWLDYFKENEIKCYYPQ
ncbi:MAG: DeoR/GlpR transcriptional regulator [Clostridia bacterium]|nr:DeoR/GlpR transcriptional regulator [Clostridia bacterium]NLS85079.1 DeoR/GlpR transcriptional regulator [Oscillospiraceae bacterium]